MSTLESAFGAVHPPDPARAGEWRTIPCDLLGEETPPVSLYLRHNDRPVLYYGSGRGDWQEIRSRLQATASHYLVHKTDFGQLQSHVAKRLRKVAGDDSLPPSERGGLVYSACYSALNESFNDLADPAAFETALETTREASTALIDHPEILPGIGLLMGHHYDTFSHSVQVSSLTIALATEIEYGSRDEIVSLGIGAMFHDLGKARVPTELIDKPGPLDDEEGEVMRNHPVWGEELLASFNAPEVSPEPVIHHHERWDGGGYPHGLAAREIPLAARITKVADVFHAVTSRRAYRSPLDAFGGAKLMKKEMPEHFDPELMDEFIRFLGRTRVEDPAA